MGELVFLASCARDSEVESLDVMNLLKGTCAQAAHPEDAPGAGAAAVLGRWRRARELDREYALNSARTLSNFVPLPLVARAALMAELANADRRDGDVEGAERYVQAAAEALPGFAEGKAGVDHEVRFLVHSIQGSLELAAGRPELAWKSIRALSDDALAYRSVTGSPLLWSHSIVRQLDLAHATDDVEGGRGLYAKARADEAWPQLSEMRRLRVEWRVVALDLIDSDTSDASAAFDQLEGHVHREFDEPDWMTDRGLLSVHLVRAALRKDDVERARRVFDGVVIDAAAVTAGERAVLRARIEQAESGADPSEALIDAVREATQRWLARPKRALARGLMHYDGQAELLELAIASLRARGSLEQALALVSEVQAAGDVARDLGASGKLDPLPLCPSEGGLLVFVPGFQVDHVFVIDAQEVRVEVLPESRRTQGLRRALERDLSRAILDDRAVDEFEARAADFAELLLRGRIEDALRKWKRVTVLGLQSFGDFPFELLRLDGQRLGDRLECGFAASLPVLARIQERPTALLDRPTLVAAIVPDPGTDSALEFPAAVPLGRGVDLQEPLFGPLESTDPVVLVDEEATLERWRASLESSPDVCLLLGHGVLDSSGTRGLLLHGGTRLMGIVSAATLSGLATPQVVVLAGCGTASFQQRRGSDGLETLDAAFLAGNSSCVVASTQQLPLNQAVEQTAAFLDGLLDDGLSPASALHRARRAAPDDLASWTLRAIGSSHRPVAVPVKPQATWWYYVLAAVSVLAAGAGVRRIHARRRA